MKKIINDPDQFASEAVEGLVLAFPHLIRPVPGAQAVLRRDAPLAGKVAVVTGGGAGHEPMFAGYVGRGMATASVQGNVFTSPPPMPIYAAAKAAHGGAGVLFLYGNYAGDVLNFDTAAAMLKEDDNIEVMSLPITDDLASAPPERSHERRGIAGDLFVFKIAGAAAEAGGTLAEVTAAARKANDQTRSMGVALSSCTIPASGRLIFDLPEAEIEIGMGIHGEPGTYRSKLLTADEIANELCARVFTDLSIKSGDEVAVLINGLGATPLSELFVVSRAVSRFLAKESVEVCRTYVGNYASSLDMAGCSVTFMKLDSELKELLLAPAESPGFVQVTA
jgi:dihydroxyacetone kinase-like protein